jgi:hypothetical protein
MTNKRKKEIMKPYITTKGIEKALMQDIGPEFVENFIHDKQFRNQLVLFILNYIKILEKHNLIKIDEYDIDSIINQLKSELDEENNSK